MNGPTGDYTHRAFSGRPLKTVDVQTVLSGALTTDDIRISVEGLERQADIARGNGDFQLAENLLRAAELTNFSESELLEYYELLRPGRATPQELRQIGERLSARGAPRLGALFTEAGTAYGRRQDRRRES